MTVRRPRRPRPCSEFDVQAHGEDVDGPAILVIGGIADELVVEGERYRLDHAAVVVSLDDAFGRVVEASIADQRAETAGREELPMRGGEFVDRAGKADGVVR